MPPKKKLKFTLKKQTIFKCGNPLCDETFSEQRGLTKHLSGENNPCGDAIRTFYHFEDRKPPAIDKSKLIGIHPKDQLSITGHTNQYFDNINWPNTNNSSSSVQAQNPECTKEN